MCNMRFMHINGTACNLIKLAYCLHSKVHNFAQEGPLVISEHLKILEDFGMHLLIKGQEISVFHYSDFETSRARKDCLTGTNLGIPA